MCGIKVFSLSIPTWLDPNPSKRIYCCLLYFCLPKRLRGYTQTISILTTSTNTINGQGLWAGATYNVETSSSQSLNPAPSDPNILIKVGGESSSTLENNVINPEASTNSFAESQSTN